MPTYIPETGAVGITKKHVFIIYLYTMVKNVRFLLIYQDSVGH